jgi:hypothetical protein
MMFSRFKTKIQPILLEMNKNKFQTFKNSVTITTTIGGGIGAIIGTYNGITLLSKQKYTGFADIIKITFGGCLDGIVQGCTYGCYPIYPLYLILNFMGEYRRIKRLTDKD